MDMMSLVHGIHQVSSMPNKLCITFVRTSACMLRLANTVEIEA